MMAHRNQIPVVWLHLNPNADMHSICVGCGFICFFSCDAHPFSHHSMPTPHLYACMRNRIPLAKKGIVPINPKLLLSDPFIRL